MIRVNLVLRFIHTGSHRSRSRLTAYIGRNAQYYWTWASAGTLTLVNWRQWQRIKAARQGKGIPGVRLYNGEETPGRCWF